MDLSVTTWIAILAVAGFTAYEWDKRSKDKVKTDGGRKLLDLVIGKWQGYGFTVEDPEYVNHMDTFYVALGKDIEGISVTLQVTQYLDRVSGRLSFHDGSELLPKQYQVDPLSSNLLSDLVADPKELWKRLEARRQQFRPQ